MIVKMYIVFMTIYLRSVSWRPDLPADGDEPLHAQLVRALARDLATGALSPGDRLPTHRRLAEDLAIGVGTVTRAYAEAERRGLVTSTVGRGTFIAEAAGGAAPPASGMIDLAHNIAPTAPAARRIRALVARLARRHDLADQIAYAPAAGFEAHRRAAAGWLAKTSGLVSADWTRLLITGGAQQAMSLVFGCLCRPGDTILTETATFFGMRSLAEHAGLRLRGAPMDAEGLTPEGLDEAARISGARVLYVLPTLQNPTGRTMGRARREAIIEIARARDLWIVEDDVYGAFAEAAPAPLAELAPERTFYISGVSKVIGPGLRTGYLVAPDADRFDRLVQAMRAVCYAPPALGALAAAQWMEDGEADAILAEVRDETRARHVLASSILGPHAERQSPAGPHIWLPLPEAEAERFAGLALRADVEVTPPSAPIVEPGAISGVRLCLGAAAGQDDLRRALTVLKGILEGGVGRTSGTV